MRGGRTKDFPDQGWSQLLLVSSDYLDCSYNIVRPTCPQEDNSSFGFSLEHPSSASMRTYGTNKIRLIPKTMSLTKQHMHTSTQMRA